MRCPPPHSASRHLRTFCSVPTKHLRILWGVPALVWTSVYMSQIGMCSVPPTNSQTSYQFSCQSSSTYISEWGTPSWACQHLLSSLDWSRSWHPRIFPVLMSLSLNESYSQHPTYFSVSMSLSLDIHKILNSCWVIKWYRFSWANWYKLEPKIVPKWCKSGPRMGEMVQLATGNPQILSWSDAESDSWHT